jgi:hypothetical protein
MMISVARTKTLEFFKNPSGNVLMGAFFTLCDGEFSNLHITLIMLLVDAPIKIQKGF